jgi:hypothetical protein
VSPWHIEWIGFLALQASSRLDAEIQLELPADAVNALIV